jgi:DNA-directed RNA polymerase specialized sigma24 family protein
VIETLSEDHRLLWDLRWYNELSQEETAEVLGVR